MVQGLGSRSSSKGRMKMGGLERDHVVNLRLTRSSARGIEVDEDDGERD